MKSQLSLAKRDLQILQLEKEIKNRKKLLVNKKKELEENNKINHYLEGVKNEYNKYYEFTIKEKQEQYDALMLLNQYIDDLIKSENLVKEDLRAAKHEQTTIIKEINKIKTELDDLLK
jgi:hypothetical protein